MYGISWQLCNRRDISKILRILYSFSSPNNVWYIDDIDRLDEKYIDLEKQMFSCSAIKEMLESIQDVISISIKIFPDSKPQRITAINTYQDFVHSACLLAFFCYDCVYQEIYCKNRTALLEIYHMLNELPVENLQWIECPNDIRTYF